MAIAALLGAIGRAPAQTSDASPPLPALRPVVCSFDFEQADAAPNALPANFVRNIAPSQGFPNFGAMRLSSSSPYSGQRSFEFELAGGSMSASVRTSVIPILPLTDYTVSAKVRTEGLHNARACLVAWLHDQAGRPIHPSRVQSQLVQTDGQWETIAVAIRGDAPEAADLVVELQVLQPGQFDDPDRDPAEPRPQDISGFVWFDDVAVMHRSRVALSMTQPHNIVHAPQAAELVIQVQEQTPHPLTAQVRVVDVHGRIVFDSAFPAPRGRQAGAVRAPLPACGWHRAVLEVRGDDEPVRRDWLDFVVLPPSSADPPHAARAPGQRQFGLDLSAIEPGGLEAAPALAAMLRADSAIVGLLPAHGRDAKNDQHAEAALRQMIADLLRRDIDVVFSMASTHDSNGAGSRRQPHFDKLLADFGSQVRRFRIDNSRELFDAFQSAVTNFAPDARLYAGWSLEQAAGPEAALQACAVSVPSHVRPDAVGEALADWAKPDHPLLIELETLSEPLYAPRQRIADLAHRVLQCWRAMQGTGEMTIAAPWRMRPDRPGRPSLKPEFAAWRTLSQELNGRVPAGELPLPSGGGLHCWIAQPREQSGGDQAAATLIAWSDALSDHETARQALHSQLADGPIEVTDLMGNAAMVEPVNGVHTIALSDLPVFIRGVNLELVQFRGSVAIEPGFVPAVWKVHEHHIILRNPWHVAISGTLRLAESDHWTLAPSAHEFTIQARGEVRLPMTITPERSILAGRKSIAAHFSLVADRPYEMDVEIGVEVGLKDIELAASCGIARNVQTGQDDLIITQAVTNHGSQRVNLDVYVLAAGVSQNRRIIAGLGSGETAVRTFRIPNGAATLAGQQLRVGVAEREGVTRLNQVLTVPTFPPPRE